MRRQIYALRLRLHEGTQQVRVGDYSPGVTITAIIPLKALGQAKGRLSGVLDAPERRALVAWMARRVIAACQACELITDVLVVAGDEAAAAIAAAASVRVVIENEPGLDGALRIAEAVTSGASATIVVAADLPAVTAADLAAVITAARGHGTAVVIAPTDDGGTGALLRRPPCVMGTAYGPASAARHAAMAREAGVDAVTVQRRGLASDVDTPEQLDDALALGAGQDVGCAPR